MKIQDIKFKRKPINGQIFLMQPPNRKEDAKKLLNKCDKGLLESNMSYGMVSRGQQQNQISLQFLVAAYKAGDTLLINKVTASLKKDMQQQAAYYESLPDGKREAMRYEEERNSQLMGGLLQMEQQFKNPAPVSENPSAIKTQPIPKAQKKDSQK